MRFGEGSKRGDGFEEEGVEGGVVGGVGRVRGGKELVQDEGEGQVEFGLVVGELVGQGVGLAEGTYIVKDCVNLLHVGVVVDWVHLVDLELEGVYQVQGDFKHQVVIL